jgi:hypothetical protein
VASLFAVYIGGSSRRNLEYGLASGRWAFTRTGPDLPSASPGDLICFGLGVAGGPQQSASSWRTRTLPEAHLSRVTSAAYVATAAFWPDERPGAPPKYNPSIDIAYLGSLVGLSLSPGTDLSDALVDALRSSGIRREAVAVTAAGSPALARGAPVLTPAPPAVGGSGGGGSRTRRGSRGGRRTIFFAPLPKNVKDITITSPAPPVTRAIERREQRLVDAYRKHMERKGHTIVRLKIVDGMGQTLWNDIYDKDLSALVEAKGSSDRNSIRMALGQVLDYARGASVKVRGVLVPDKPEDDLIDLLKQNDVVAIWTTRTGFADSAGAILV